MPRIQFSLPDHFIFSTDIQIYISHVNQGGHLDNAQLLTLVSEARVRFFKSLGYTEGNVGGYAIVVGDIVAQYKSEGFHGETMRVSLIPQDYNKYGFGIVFIERATRKVSLIPPEFLQRVQDCPPILS
jgi:acyl-CoA thioester hydrolase